MSNKATQGTGDNPLAGDGPGQGPPWVGPARVVGFLLGAMGWLLVVVLGTSALMVGIQVLQGHSMEDVAQLDLNGLLTPGLVALTTAVQTCGMVLVAVAFVGLMPRREPNRWRRAFALRRSSVAMWVLGLAGGFTVGVFPGWLAEQITEALPGLSLGNNEMIGRLLSEGPLLGRVAMVLVVVVVAPIAEELLFRGYLWDAFERTFPSPVVLVLTSLLFAAFHMDPIAAVALLFTGSFLGWLRHTSGSVGPCIAAHVANNTLASIVAIAVGFEGEEATPLAPALCAGTLTLVLCLVAWLVSRRATRQGS